MGLFLKTTAGLLLLVQAFHLASLQYTTTDSTGKTTDRAWLRDRPKNLAVSPPAEEIFYDPGADMTESSNDFSSGIASGSMAVDNEEEKNVASDRKDEYENIDDMPAVTTNTPQTNVSSKQPELRNATDSPPAATTNPANTSQTNMTEVEEEFHNSTATPPNSTTHLSAENSTSLTDHANRTDLQTAAPESYATQESTTKSDEEKELTMGTKSTSKPEVRETPTTSSSTAALPSETTETSPATTTAPITPEKANKTDKDAASGSSSERGWATDSHKSKRKGAWGAVLGTAVAVACVGLVAYLILKKKHRKGFSHRKLQEEYPSDPD
ncbi:mucin-15 isoform X2 [Plectropomus leopardus]|uniref:mucin-15 isoform X2 n=1 Tax=Plectropomus leopardus TaxID=160734 RepID=UPI001C4C7EC9|nr:mucin-15 isoform X2 [Plectropomus leopardus]